MPIQRKLAPLLPGCFLGSALLFDTSMIFFIAAVLWQNISRLDRVPLTLSLIVLILVSGLSGLVVALLGYKATRGQTFNHPAWRAGSRLFAGALLVGVAALIAIKFAFPALPE